MLKHIMGLYHYEYMLITKYLLQAHCNEKILKRNYYF